jgi:hypothetical protein
MYKCPSASGITFQQLPCEGGQAMNVKSLNNGKGADTSHEIEYLNQLKAEQNKLKEEEKQVIEEKNKERAIKEIIKEKSIVNGKTRNERWKECIDSGGGNSCHYILRE